MALYIVPAKGISCGACWADCNVEAIEIVHHKYAINVEKCVDCSACQYVCPNDAIFYDKDTAIESVNAEIAAAKEKVAAAKAAAEKVDSKDEEAVGKANDAVTAAEKALAEAEAALASIN